MKGLSKIRLSVFALCFLVIFGAGVAVGRASQPYMVSARTYLNYALSQLEQAKADKGGHRVNAINYVKAALHEVNLGIQYAGG